METPRIPSQPFHRAAVRAMNVAFARGYVPNTHRGLQPEGAMRAARRTLALTVARNRREGLTPIPKADTIGR